MRIGPPDDALLSTLRQAMDSDFWSLRTVIHVTGEITAKDAAEVTTELDRLWQDTRFTFQEGITVLAILDSPGGSFSAGIALSRAFAEKGVSTVVPPGGSCLSACAVAFMAGRHVSMGGEGSISRSRSVVMPAELGFHRPFLADTLGPTISPNVIAQLSSEELGVFFAERFTESFDAANALLQEMLAVDPDAWHPDLLFEMLTARQGGPEGGFVRLETVEDALTWDIAVPNVPPPPLRTAEDRFEVAFAFCFNVGPTLNSSVSGFWDTPADLLTTYEFNARGGHFQPSDGEGNILIFVYHEAPMGCDVSFPEGRPTMTVGQGFGGGPGDPVSRLDDWLAGYRSDTLLRDVATPVGSTAGYRCVVLDGSRVLDDESCSREQHVAGDGEVVEFFVWPSGSRTVVQTRGARQILNGARASVADLPNAALESCLWSAETMRTFCYGRR